MKVSKNWLKKRHYKDWDPPNLWFDGDEFSVKRGGITIPDDWICYVTFPGNLPAVGSRGDGVPIISSKGYENNKDEIIQTYVKGRLDLGVQMTKKELRERFKKHADRYYETLRENKEKDLEEAYEKLDEAQEEDGNVSYWKRKIEALENFPV